jgi:hypothetical protein
MAMIGDVIRRALGAALRNARYSALFLLAGSEALIVEWLLRAVTGRSLGLALGLALACGLAVMNVATLALLPAFARRARGGYRLSRFWLVGSLGALISGPPLALAFAVFAPLAWRIRRPARRCRRERAARSRSASARCSGVGRRPAPRRGRATRLQRGLPDASPVAHRRFDLHRHAASRAAAAG